MKTNWNKKPIFAADYELGLSPALYSAFGTKQYNFSTSQYRKVPFGGFPLWRLCDFSS